MNDWLSIANEVREAMARGDAIVALESSLIAHGLPPPHNLETARASEEAVRDAGAIPATVAVADGRIVVGAHRHLLETLADPAAHAAKAAARDFGPLLSRGALAATTAGATMRAAWMAGIAMVATGGIGGVHRDAARSFDISGDLDEIAATPVAVVCSGAKAILDLGPTLEHLETRRVPVVGYGVDELPAFYARSSGLALAHRVDGAAEAAAVIAAHLALPGGGGLLLVQPPPEDVAVDRAQAEAWAADALRDSDARGTRGASVTPQLLAGVASASGGRALRVNSALIVNNARTAAKVAVQLAAMRG